MILISDMGKGISFYDVLGLQKNCSTSDVRYAYKKLAMKWHPDKCSAGDSTAAEQAKRTFQAIQEAYSVLSDENRRLLYDVGLYDVNEEEQESRSYGMDDFLGEMAALMTENKPKPNGGDNFEELKDLFMKILDSDKYIPTCSQKQAFHGVGARSSSKRNWTEEHFQFTKVHISGTEFEGFQTTGFCMGASSGSSCAARKGKKRGTRKQKGDHAEMTSHE